MAKSSANGVTALIFFILGLQVAVFSFRAIYRGEGDAATAGARPPEAGVVNGGNAVSGQSEQSAPSSGPAGGRRTTPRSSGQGSPAARKYAPAAEPRKPFPFDPNLATEDEFVRLGFSPAQAASIVRYRSSGHIFHSKSDFARIYAVSDEMMERLDEYIMVTPLDLNRADSADFTTLNGIGPYFAGRIVAYRRLIGSFAVKEQLLEVRGMDRERYDALQSSVTVDPSGIRHYRIDRLEDSLLLANPYIGSGLAAAVRRWCRTTPDSLHTVAIMEKEKVLPHANAARLSLYDTAGRSTRPL